MHLSPAEDSSTQNIRTGPGYFFWGGGTHTWGDVCVPPPKKYTDPGPESMY